MPFDVDLTPDTYFSVPITKAEQQPDGSVLVWGCPANPEEVDNDGQIADADWLKRELPAWFHSYGNMREMHQPSAVGTAKKLTWGPDDKPEIVAKIVDPLAAKKVREGVYKAFSVGVKKPELRRDPKARNGRIVGGKIVEVSTVDRPSIPGSDIAGFKSDGVDEYLLCKAVGANEWLDAQTGAVVVDEVAEMLDDGRLEKVSAGELVWDTSTASERVKQLVGECLNGPMDGLGCSPRYWVMDVNSAEGKALVQDWPAGGSDGATGWVVPYDRDGDEISIAPASEWTPAKQEWVNASKAAHRDELEHSTGGRMDEKTVEADAAKRDFDPAVGGGVDRDKIPAEDFAGKDRSYPIVTPGDVSDAATSIGQAGEDNYSSEQLKENIIRIAHRKGPEFVAELPASWREEKAAIADDAKGVEASIDKEARSVDAETKSPKDGAEGEVIADADETKGGALAQLEKAMSTQSWCPDCGSMQKIDGGETVKVGSHEMLVGTDAAGHELRKYVGKTVEADKTVEEEKADTVEKDDAGEAADDGEKTAAAADGGDDEDTGEAVDTDVSKGEEGLAKLLGAPEGALFKAAILEELAETLGVDLGKVGRRMAAKRLAAFKDAVAQLKAITDELSYEEMPDTEKAASAVGGPAGVNGTSGLNTTQIRDAIALVARLCNELGDGDALGHDGDKGDAADDKGVADKIRIADRIDTNEKAVGITAEDLTKQVTAELTKTVGPELAKSVAAHMEGLVEPLVQRLEKVEHTAVQPRPPVLLAAERGHVLAGDTEKAARSEEVLRADLEKRLANLSDQDREEILATVVANTRGWR